MDYKVASHMLRFSRLAIGAIGAATCLLGARPARAQVSCDTLPNPIIVAGPTDFEPLLQRFAVKIAAESPAATIITPSISALATSCAAVEGVVTGIKLGGLPGRYYRDAHAAARHLPDLSVNYSCSFSVTTATCAAPPPRARSRTCIARSYETPSWASK